MPIPTKFPVIVSRGGSFRAKIYQVKDEDAKTGFAYTVRWGSGRGGVRSLQRRKFEVAKEEAVRVVDQLSRGILAGESLTQQDILLLDELKQIAGETGPAMAMREWEQARKLAGPAVIEACKHWQSRAHKLERKSVYEIVEAFLADKKTNGFQTAKTQGSIFRAFQSTFRDRMIDEIKAHEFKDYLEKADDLETRRTIRKRLVTLCRWARLMKHIEEGVLEIERTAKPKLKKAEIGVISPANFEELLVGAGQLTLLDPSHSRGELLCAAILSGFCGLRRAEVHGQIWDDIDGVELIVTRSKEGTPADRRIPICPAALAWLKLIKKKKRGEKMAPAYAVDALRKFGRQLGLKLPDNCFRHTYISSRVGVTGNVNLVSLEAGNSPAIIHRHYRRPLGKAEAQSWFKIMPPVALAKLAHRLAKTE